MTESVTTKKATVYTHPECGYCDLLKDDLRETGTEFDEVDLSKESHRWGEVEELSGGDRITPVLLKADGTVEVGYHGIGCAF